MNPKFTGVDNLASSTEDIKTDMSDHHNDVNTKKSSEQKEDNNTTISPTGLRNLVHTPSAATLTFFVQFILSLYERSSSKQDFAVTGTFGNILDRWSAASKNSP